MTIKGMKVLQIIALVIAAVTALLCVLIAVRPGLVGIAGFEGVRIVPIAALVNSVGCILIGAIYLVMMHHTKTEKGTKGTVIAITLLLCVLTVIIEPLLGMYESRQVNMLLPEADNAAVMMTTIQGEQGMRELARLLLFVSKALTILSLGGFWKNPAFKGNKA